MLGLGIVTEPNDSSNAQNDSTREKDDESRKRYILLKIYNSLNWI